MVLCYNRDGLEAYWLLAFIMFVEFIGLVGLFGFIELLALVKYSSNLTG